MQMAWIAKMLKKDGFESSSRQCIPMEISPDIPLWNKPPVLAEYLLKPLFIWHLENQFGISITKGKCPHCQKIGSMKFKEYTNPRYIHCLTTNAYMVSAQYICDKKTGGCKKVFTICDEDIVKKANLLPSSVFLKCPVQLYEKTAWKSDLVQSMFDLVSGRAKMNDFVAMVRNARTSEYMKTACAYRDHIDYYLQLQLSRDRLTSTHSTTQQYHDFPRFFQHCQGTKYHHKLMFEFLKCEVYQTLYNNQHAFHML